MYKNYKSIKVNSCVKQEAQLLQRNDAAICDSYNIKAELLLKFICILAFTCALLIHIFFHGQFLLMFAI